MKKNFPQPKTVPILGNLLDLDVNSPVQSLIEISKRYDGIYKMDLPSRSFYVVTSHRLANELCDESRFDKRLHGPLQEIRNFAGDGAYGHGESGGKVSSVVHMARSINAVLEYFVKDPKAIIAHSMGTSALLLHLSIHKTEVDFLALISAPIEGPLAHSKKFAEKIKISERVRAQMQAQLEWQLDHPWEELEIPALLYFAKAAETLLIHDENDKVVPIENLERIQKQLPKSKALKTSGVGHFKILESPITVAHVMKHLGVKTLPAKASLDHQHQKGTKNHE